MGAACCVAARDRTIQHGSNGENQHRNFRYSPSSFSLRWDNRVGVIAEETSAGWLSDVANRSGTLDIKSSADGMAHVSNGGSSAENYQMGTWRKSPLHQETAKSSRTSVSGQSITRNSTMEAKQSTGSLQVPNAPSLKLSPSTHSTPSLSMSPISTQTQMLPPPSSTPSRWAPRGSPGHQLGWHASDIATPSSGRNSPTVTNSISEEGKPKVDYSRPSTGRYSSDDCFSEDAFSEVVSISNSGRYSTSVSANFQNCGICSKLLTEKSAFSTQKIIEGSNELSVVAVLTCGHVYHAECLETITPDINKYDPACPICTFGEKQTLKLSAKMLKAERELKGRNSKKSRNRVVGPDDYESFEFDSWKSGPHEGRRSPKLGASSSLKISAAKPFLRRHFSFGSKGNKSGLESSSGKKKGLFWAKSSRV